jgi:hypothetical protein
MQYTYSEVGINTAGDFTEGQETVLGKISGMSLWNELGIGSNKKAAKGLRPWRDQGRALRVLAPPASGYPQKTLRVLNPLLFALPGLRQSGRFASFDANPIQIRGFRPAQHPLGVVKA